MIVCVLKGAKQFLNNLQELLTNLGCIHQGREWQALLGINHFNHINAADYNTMCKVSSRFSRHCRGGWNWKSGCCQKGCNGKITWLFNFAELFPKLGKKSTTTQHPHGFRTWPISLSKNRNKNNDMLRMVKYNIKYINIEMYFQRFRTLDPHPPTV